MVDEKKDKKNRWRREPMAAQAVATDTIHDRGLGVKVKPVEDFAGTDADNLLATGEHPLAALARDAKKALIEGGTEDWRDTMKWLRSRGKKP